MDEGRGCEWARQAPEQIAGTSDQDNNHPHTSNKVFPLQAGARLQWVSFRPLAWDTSHPDPTATAANEAKMKEAFSRLPDPAPYLVRYSGTLDEGVFVEVEGEENLNVSRAIMAAVMDRLKTGQIDVSGIQDSAGEVRQSGNDPAFWRNASNEPVRLALAAALGRDISCKAAAFFVAALAGEGEERYRNGASIVALKGLRSLIGRRVIYVSNRNPFLAEISSISTKANGSTRINFRNLHAPGLPSAWPYSAPVPDELIAEERLTVFQELLDTESCYGYMGVFELYSNQSVIQQICAIGEKGGICSEMRGKLIARKQDHAGH